MTNPALIIPSRATRKQMRHALMLAKLSLLAIADEKDPPDAKVCRVIASGALVRIDNALESAQ